MREVNLYDLSVEILKDRGVWERVLAFEPDHDKDDLREMLQAMLDPQLHPRPGAAGEGAGRCLRHRLPYRHRRGLPYIRSHNVLNNLQSVVTGKPMPMFFPGDYRQSDSLGSSLVLFNKLTDDQYYRAKNILEQEA